MDAPLIPEQEGMRERGTQADANGFIPKHALTTGASRSLLQMNEEYAFFTPALLYLLTNFRDDPLADFQVNMGEPVKFYYRKFSHPIFRGLNARSNGDPAWNFVLWAIERPFWRAFSDFMVSIVLSDTDAGQVYGVGEQELVVIDPLAMDRAFIYSNALPRLPVTAFGINGSNYRAAFRIGENPLLDPPSLVFYARDPTMQAYAKALFAGDNPVNARANCRSLSGGTQ